MRRSSLRPPGALPMLAGAALGLALLGGAFLWERGQRDAEPSSPSRADRGAERAEAPSGPSVPRELACGPGPYLALADGSPPVLSCDQARRVIRQANDLLAAPGPNVDARQWAAGLTDWLDPHGLWSAAPDAPLRAHLRGVSGELLAEIAGPDEGGRCHRFLEVSEAMPPWIAKLRASFQAGFEQGRAALVDDAFAAASTTPFEDGAVTQPADELARRLGQDVGEVVAAYGDVVMPYARAAEARYLPDLGAGGWSDAMRAAAVRAYLPLVDAHGAWAPLEEETALYDLGLEVAPPDRLWTAMTRTAVGLRIDEGAHAPLRVNDVVLSIDDTAMAGLSIEQADQYSLLVSGPSDLDVVVLRRDSPRPLRLHVERNEPPAAPTPVDDDPVVALEATVVAFGSGEAVAITVPDVPDDLGDQLAELIQDAAGARGILLDLRGNGGGSTDGALAALGLFLPDAPMFPMKRRDGSIEVDKAPAPPRELAWTGPVAALVDGDSASAAEMIAGALMAYDRGPVIGSTTYGKGCAQEFIDDQASVGVLRLTTLVFALPDGAPLQKVGLVPDVSLHLAPATEREAHIAIAPSPWRGPDVRAKTPVAPPWPTHQGQVGPCEDPVVCRALRSLGTGTATAAKR